MFWVGVCFLLVGLGCVVLRLVLVNWSCLGWVDWLH